MVFFDSARGGGGGHDAFIIFFLLYGHLQILAWYQKPGYLVGPVLELCDWIQWIRFCLHWFPFLCLRRSFIIFCYAYRYIRESSSFSTSDCRLRCRLRTGRWRMTDFVKWLRHIHTKDFWSMMQLDCHCLHFCVRKLISWCRSGIIVSVADEFCFTYDHYVNTMVFLVAAHFKETLSAFQQASSIFRHCRFI